MKGKTIAGVVLGLALVALFVPFVPATLASGHILSIHYQQTASESPSYYAFHCGAYINPRVSAQIGSGFNAFYQASKGYTFSCNYSAG